MIPIPKFMLIHSATHNYGKTQDEWGNNTWGHTQALSNVRFEPSTRLVKTKDNQELQLSALMFFDARNSIPAAWTCAVGDQIIHESLTYEVVAADPIYDTALHHWEIGLR